MPERSTSPEITKSSDLIILFGLLSKRSRGEPGICAATPGKTLISVLSCTTALAKSRNKVKGMQAAAPGISLSKLQKTFTRLSIRVSIKTVPAAGHATLTIFLTSIFFVTAALLAAVASSFRGLKSSLLLMMAISLLSNGFWPLLHRASRSATIPPLE